MACLGLSLGSILGQPFCFPSVLSSVLSCLFSQKLFQSLENAQKIFPIIGKLTEIFQPLEKNFPIILERDKFLGDRARQGRIDTVWRKRRTQGDFVAWWRRQRRQATVWRNAGGIWRERNFTQAEVLAQPARNSPKVVRRAYRTVHSEGMRGAVGRVRIQGARRRTEAGSSREAQSIRPRATSAVCT